MRLSFEGERTSRHRLRWHLALVTLASCFSFGPLGPLGPSSVGAQPIALSLDEAVHRALATDPRLAGAEAEHARRDAEASVARGHLLPRVDFEQSVGRTDHPVQVFGARLLQGRFAESDFAIPALNDPNAITDHASVLRAEMPLVHVEGWLGARASRAMARSAEAGVRQQALELTARVVRLYHQAALATRAVEVATAAVTAARTDAEAVASALRHGNATELDVLELDVQVAAVEERRIETEGHARIARAALAHAIGAPTGAELRLSDMPHAPLAPPVFVDADDVSIAEHPQVVRAEEAERAAMLARRASRARFAPVIAGAVELQSHRANLSRDALHGESFAVGVVLRLNLFRGLQDLAGARAADAMVHAAEADAAFATSAVRLQIRSAQVALESAHARVEVAGRAVALATRVLETQRRRLESGLGETSALLRARTALLDAELRHLESHYAERLARVDLAVALGHAELGEDDR